MKWFKHYTNAHKGTAIQMLRPHFGRAESYGLYFLFTEYLADKWDGSSEPKFKVFKSDLRSFLGLKQNKLSSFLVCLQNELKITVKETENILEIYFPKLLEIRHRDAIPSSQRPEKVQPNSRLEKNKRKNNTSASAVLSLEALLEAIPKETQAGWSKLYAKEFIDRELIKAWNYYLDEKPKTLRGWSRAIGGWLERTHKWAEQDRKKGAAETGGWEHMDGV